MTAQQLKNSILQMAVQGKLVPQDPNDEPASVLLERIRTEKERLIREKKIKREKNPSFIFRGADNIPYEKVGDTVTPLEVPFEIPESWEWVTLKSVAISELGKTLDKAKNRGELRPYLCSINVYWDGIDLETVKQARFEETELPKYLLRPGDLLICEGGVLVVQQCGKAPKKCIIKTLCIESDFTATFHHTIFCLYWSFIKVIKFSMNTARG